MKLSLKILLLIIHGVLSVKPPNIVFILVDDVGWADFNYTTSLPTSIPTPRIDSLARSGLILSQHYVHPTCTPSRAALMTGRYSVNTGLTFAMYPGSVAGLPPDMVTLPQVMRRAGYRAHMVGKWHLGHAQPKQGPIGRGFESHTGSYMWDLESYTKLMWNMPWGPPFGADWVTSFENGSSRHFAEPRHSTIALTSEALKVMDSHSTSGESSPLFLYLSYNAAHSPLQPEPEWLDKCGHIPHLWRRQFCGMVVGLDENIDKVVTGAKRALGEDTIVIVSSDNGGAPHFGGLNQPLRSGKHTSFEGGVRVPAFALDFSGGNYLGQPGRQLDSLIHISDWMPTFMALANKEHLLKDMDLDGLDQSGALRTGIQARKSVLLDLYTRDDSHDGKSLVAYRKGDFKLISGSYKDPNWYYEPTEDHVKSSDTGLRPRIIENFARFMDWIFGEGPCDNFRMLIHNLWLFNSYAASIDPDKPLLFNVKEDPEEKHNLSEENQEVIDDIMKDVVKILASKPTPPKYWLTSRNWTDGFTDGDCLGQDVLRSDYCKFTSSWLSDEVNLELEDDLDLVDIAKEATREILLKLLISMCAIILSIAFLIRTLWKKN